MTRIVLVVMMLCVASSPSPLLLRLSVIWLVLLRMELLVVSAFVLLTIMVSLAIVVLLLPCWLY